MMRIFNPVGQGGFYCEFFEDDTTHETIKIVYDCGSMPKRNVEREMGKIFQENEYIDAVFISHLHDDHINGLQNLIKDYKVKNIFLPLLSNEEKNIIKIKYYLEKKTTSFEFDFFKNPQKALNNICKNGFKVPKLYFVSDSKNDFDREKKEDLKIIKSGENVASIIGGIQNIELFWRFKPFNIEQEYYTEILIKALQKEGLELEDLDKLKDLDNYDINILCEMDFQKKLKRAFSKLKGHNKNSMTLFSGPSDNNLNSNLSDYREFMNERNLSRHFIKEPQEIFIPKNLGCLYTGDYDAKLYFRVLKEAYVDVWDYIEYFQVPHHGSAKNINESFVKNGARYIISAGNKNRYKHPNPDVINMIRESGGFVNVVTENYWTRVTCIALLEETI